jgi:hypothetical protein
VRVDIRSETQLAEGIPAGHGRDSDVEYAVGEWRPNAETGENEWHAADGSVISESEWNKQAEAAQAEAEAAAAADAEIPEVLEELKAGPWAGSVMPMSDPDQVPPGFEIKGNEQSEKYHVPGSRYYDATKAELWFRSVDAAEGAGYTPPGGSDDMSDSDADAPVVVEEEATAAPAEAPAETDEAPAEAAEAPADEAEAPAEAAEANEATDDEATIEEDD